ncbi:MAG: hypothetical protein ACF8SC_05375, partial [Phycisphaerales bacterium JB037]
LMGGRVVKPVFLVMGTLTGVLLGAAFGPMLAAEEVMGKPSPYVGMVLGGVGGLFLSAMIFRLAMVVSATAVFAAAGLLGGVCFVQFRPPEAPPEPSATPASLTDATPARTTPEETEIEIPLLDRSHASGGSDEPLFLGTNTPSAEDFLRGADELLADREGAERLGGELADRLRHETLDRLDAETAASIKSAARQVRGFLDRLYEQTGKVLTGLSDEDQMLVGASTIGAGLFGLMLGGLMPTRSAKLVTSLAGAFIWLSSFVWIAHAMELPGREWLYLSPLGWAVVWMIVSSLGAMYQVSRGGGGAGG